MQNSVQRFFAISLAIYDCFWLSFSLISTSTSPSLLVSVLTLRLFLSRFSCAQSGCPLRFGPVVSCPPLRLRPVCRPRKEPDLCRFRGNENGTTRGPSVFQAERGSIVGLAHTSIYRLCTISVGAYRRTDTARASGIILFLEANLFRAGLPVAGDSVPLSSLVLFTCRKEE